MQKYRHWEVRGRKGAYEVPVLQKNGLPYKFETWKEVAEALEAYFPNYNVWSFDDQIWL